MHIVPYHLYSTHNFFMYLQEEPSSSCGGEQASLEHILASELYPKKSMKTEDPSLAVPYPILPGESVEYLGKTADGVIALSNFRLLAKHGTVVMNIPLALIDTIECRDIFFLYVYCKDARSFRSVLLLLFIFEFLTS